MSLRKLAQKPLQFLLFGGKGGVGKTTMAAASAVHFAELDSFQKKKVLVFTTDPAPSLADSFNQKLGNEPTPIRGQANLYGMEIDAKKVLEDFKEEYGEEILDIIEQGSYLSGEEAKEVFSLDIPGLDEVMGLKKITDFMDAGDYDLYIVDTAPTGHTLRLLTLPDLLDGWIKWLARMRWKYRAVRAAFAGESQIEKADQFLVDMKKVVKRVEALLKDPARTEFVIVTIPEALGVLETRDLVRDLAGFHIPHRHIIVNNIVPEDPSKFLQARRAHQEHYIKELTEAFPGLEMTRVTLRAEEIRGLDHLRQLGKELFR